jgi:hypothetical protein
MLLAILSASLATALFSHTAISYFAGFLASASELPRSPYGQHAHGTIGPVGLVAALLAITMALKTIAAALAKRHTVLDPLEIAAQRLAGIDPMTATILVAVGGLSTLVTMEFVEQFATFGHASGFGDALGGNPLAGLALIALFAAAVTATGLRCAHFSVGLTLAVAILFSNWVRRIATAPLDVVAALARSCDIDWTGLATYFCARCSGLRAPPSNFVTN